MKTCSLYVVLLLVSLLAFSQGKPIEGYNYPVPDNPLVLPTRKTTTTTTTARTQPEKEEEKEEGYNYPVPENPLILSSTTTTSTSTTEAPNGYSYVTPENPLILPPKATTTTSTITEKGYEYPLPENPLTLPPRSSSTENPPEIVNLPFCPEESEDELQIDIRSSGLIPGVDCRPMPICSDEDINLRSSGEDVTCRTIEPTASLIKKQLPFCPEESDDEAEIDVRSSVLIPGVDCEPLPICSDAELDLRSSGVDAKCRRVELKTDDISASVEETERSLPFCPEESEDKLQIDIRSSGLIPGVDCQPMPICTDEDIDLRSSGEDVKCRTIEPTALLIKEQLPFCPEESDDETEIDLRSSALIPGVDCELLPFCTDDDIDLKSSGEDVKCRLVKLLDDDFQLDLRTLVKELPDFDPEDFFDGSNGLLNGQDSIEGNTEFPIPLTTPSTVSQRLVKVSVIEPVLVKTCVEMKEEGQEEPAPGVNCVDDRSFSLLNENSDIFKTCLELAQDGQIEPKPGVNCIHEVVPLFELDDQQNILVGSGIFVENDDTKHIVGKDFNLATAIFQNDVQQ